MSSRNNDNESSIAQRARQERQARESRRQLDRAARRIQAFYRSRTAAGAARDGVRAEVDAVLLSTAGTSSDGSDAAAAQLLEATARLAFAYRTGNKGDAARLGKWARLVATGRPRVRLFQTFEELCSGGGGDSRVATTRDAAQDQDQRVARWKYTLSVLCQKMCRVAADSPR